MKLLDQVTSVIRRNGYARETEKTYKYWIRAFICFHRGPDGWRHPADMGAPEVEAFLTDLAVRRNVAVATQKLALNAIVFASASLSRDPVSGRRGRWHIHPTSVRNVINAAAARAGQEGQSSLGLSIGVPPNRASRSIDVAA